MTANKLEGKASDIHSCSYYCDRPECVKAQRDELREAYVARQSEGMVEKWLNHAKAMEADGWYTAAEFAYAAAAELGANPASIPEGSKFALVPKEPTEAMLSAAQGATLAYGPRQLPKYATLRRKWAAMLAAAPADAGEAKR